MPSSAAAASPPPPGEPRHGGFTRFELELEFVQSLANPAYLNHLATEKLLDRADFVAYLAYLHRCFAHPRYARFLHHPAPTLRALELLQHEPFRKAILNPALVEHMTAEGVAAAATHAS